MKSFYQAAGFTLIEVLIIVPILMLVITGMVAYMVAMLNMSTRADIQNRAVYDTHAAFDTVETDVKITKTFLVSIDDVMSDAYGSYGGTGTAWLSDPYGPNGSGATWSVNTAAATPVAGGYAYPVILRMFATSKNVHDPTKAPVYINRYGCTPATINTNPPLTVNVIYFESGGNLYRRTLIPPTTTDTTTISTPSHVTTCTTPYQQQTCPAGNPLASATCTATDQLVLSNVSIIITTFTGPSGVAMVPSPSTPLTQTDLDGANSLRFYVGTRQTVNGAPLDYGATYQFTKVNS